MTNFVVLCIVFAFPVVAGNGVYKMEIGKGLGEFQYENCNKSAVPVAFRHISLSPDPIQYGQDLIVTAELVVTQTIGLNKPVKVDVTANLIEEGQKYDMCNYGKQYCHYADICQTISDLKPKCPALVKKLGNNCRCPLKPGTYTVTKIPIKIPNASFQIQGRFQVQIDMTESNKQVGCFFMDFCLGTC